jgi:hypothetical protein
MKKYYERNMMIGMSEMNSKNLEKSERGSIDW